MHLTETLGRTVWKYDCIRIFCSGVWGFRFVLQCVFLSQKQFWKQRHVIIVKCVTLKGLITQMVDKFGPGLKAPDTTNTKRSSNMFCTGIQWPWPWLTGLAFWRKNPLYFLIATFTLVHNMIPCAEGCLQRGFCWALCKEQTGLPNFTHDTSCACLRRKQIP